MYLGALFLQIILKILCLAIHKVIPGRELHIRDPLILRMYDVRVVQVDKLLRSEARAPHRVVAEDIIVYAT